MPSQLESFTIPNWGQRGLNTEDLEFPAESGFVSTADNVVFSKDGMLELAKKWTTVQNGRRGLPAPVGSEAALFNYVRPSTGNSVVFAAINDKIYATNNMFTTNFADITGGTAWTRNEWQFVPFNGYVYAFQPNAIPKRLVDAGTAAVDVGGSPPNAYCACAAYGRIWAGGNGFSNRYTLYWSDTLNGDVWAAGSAGSLDLRTIWTNGEDRITAIAAYNGNIIVFGERSITVFSTSVSTALTGTNTYSPLVLVEVIQGVGCAFRNTVRNVGNDIFFADWNGLFSLQRVLVQKSLPINNVSRHVTQDLVNALRYWKPLEDSGGYARASGVMGIHVPGYNWYVLAVGYASGPTNTFMLVFDLNRPMEDGSYACTKMSGAMSPIALCTYEHNANDIDTASGGDTHTLLYLNDGSYADNNLWIYGSKQYYVTGLTTEMQRTGYVDTPWLNFGSRVQLKVLKQALLAVKFLNSAASVLYYDIATDYAPFTAYAYTPNITPSGTYPKIVTTRVPLSGSGAIAKIRVGLSSAGENTTDQPSFQSLTVLFKKAGIYKG